MILWDDEHVGDKPSNPAMPRDTSWRRVLWYALHPRRAMKAHDEAIECLAEEVQRHQASRANHLSDLLTRSKERN